MLSIQENELLTRVGPGTPMGELMRRYWHPIAAVDELDNSPFRTREIRLMGEDLVLYRDRSGRLGLIESRCAHRRVNLAYGVVEEDGIRCQYHGWKYDSTGACVEQPFEETVRPDGRFKEKCGLKGYRVEELCGLIFAYLGPEPAPLLPRWAPLVWDNAVRDICITELPCNWLQCQENSLDPVHTEWLHRYFGTYAKQLIKGGAPDFSRGQHHIKIGFDVFEHGIIKRRVSLPYDENHDEWKVGHPILFPNILLVGSPDSNTMQFRVPIDDARTYHVSVYTWRAAPGTQAPMQEVIPSRQVPILDENGRFIVDIQFNQDYMAWATQGDIAVRNKEKLGESDKGIILFRRMLKEQLQRVMGGEDPSINMFRDPMKNVCVETAIEPSRSFTRRGSFTYVPQEAGYSRDGAKIEATLKTWAEPQPLIAHIGQRTPGEGIVQR